MKPAWNPDLICPYCGASNDIGLCGRFGCQENKIYEYECTDCDKKFDFQISFITYYVKKKEEI